MPTREQEIMRVRELLDAPKEQRPGMHAIASELIRQEQFQMNLLNNTGRPWSQNSTTITTVADTAEYTLTPTNFGKPLFVFRALDNNVSFPVPFTDYTHEIGNQSYEFWLAPAEANLIPFFSGEKCAFFRTSAGTKKMRIYPIPETAAIVYTVVYAAGWQDWTAFALSDVPILPEWSDLRTINTALFLLPRTDWPGLTRQDNSAKRNELVQSLQGQMLLQKNEFDSYVRSPNFEPIASISNWYE